MATPKTLKRIEENKALTIISKHLKAGTGYWEAYPNYSDFIYKTSGGKTMMIRPGFRTYETGVVVM